MINQWYSIKTIRLVYSIRYNNRETKAYEENGMKPQHHVCCIF